MTYHDESNVCPLMRLAPTHREPETRRRDPDGWPLPECDDGAPLALNLEEGIGGALVPSRGAEPVADVGAKPLMADRQGGETFLYMADSSLRLSRLRLPEAGSAQAAPSDICTLAATPRQMVRCGDFLVIRLDDDTLHYLTVDPATKDTFSLGAVPQPPQVCVRAVACREVTVSTDPVTFPKAVADLRTGVPPEVTARIRSAAQTAAVALQQKVRGLGLWSAPVCVRVAVRLRDGSLLCVSEPRLVGFGRHPNPRCPPSR